jgi:hypothetical protein
MFRVESAPNEKDLLEAIQKVKATAPDRIRIVFVSHKLISASHSYDHVNHVMEFNVAPQPDRFNTFLKSGKLSQRLINHFYPEIQRCTKVRVVAIAGDRYDN